MEAGRRVAQVEQFDGEELWTQAELLEPASRNPDATELPDWKQRRPSGVASRALPCFGSPPGGFRWRGLDGRPPSDARVFLYEDPKELKIMKPYVPLGHSLHLFALAE